MLQSASGRRAAEERDRSATPKGPGDSPSVSSPSEESEGGADAESYDDWLQHMRVIEFLRNGIRNRLERRDYEEDNDTSRIDPMVLDSDRRNNSSSRNSSDSSKSVESRPLPPQPLYPVLPRIG